MSPIHRIPVLMDDRGRPAEAVVFFDIVFTIANLLEHGDIDSAALGAPDGNGSGMSSHRRPVSRILLLTVDT